MKEFTWTQELAPRSRAAWLVFFKDGEARPFEGRDIPGWCVVRERQSGPRRGKWTPTIWRLVLADSVLAVAGHYGWNTGDFPEGLWSALGKRGSIPASWAEWAALLAGTVGVPAEEARALLRAMDPEVAARWDRAEEKIRELLGGGEASTGPAQAQLHPSAERNRSLLHEALPAVQSASRTIVTVEVRPRRFGGDYDAPLEVVLDGEVVARVVPLPPGPNAAEPNEVWWAAAWATGAASFAAGPAIGQYGFVWFKLDVPAGAELRHPALRQTPSAYVIDG